jgi:3D (Asp-Asp-Asp) domain-containing protein
MRIPDYKVILASHVFFVLVLVVFTWNMGHHLYRIQRIDALQAELERTRAVVGTISELAFGKEMEIDDFVAQKVKLTSYNPVPSQGWGDGTKTADGKLANPNVVALSHDLMAKYHLKFGARVILKGYGVFTVTDTMNKRHRNSVDIISFIPKWSKQFGTRTATLYIPRGMA